MYAVSRGPRPVSLGASLLISGAILSALVFISPDFVVKDPPPPLVAGSIKAPEPPPPEPEPEIKPKNEIVRDQPIVAPDPVIRAPDVIPTIPTTPNIDQPPTTPYVGKAEGTAATPTPAVEKPVLPPLIGATTDPRYARDFQPDYPAAELRLGNEIVFKVRIRIGIDGRVKEIEQMGSDAGAFWNVTRRHALAKWRFKPATRAGIPEESWKTMTVRFELNE